MSWPDDIDWDDVEEDEEDFMDTYRYVAPVDCYPLEYHPFRQLVDAAIGYMDTQRDVLLYDTAHYEFMALATSFAATTYERELKFSKFLQLPAELRTKVYRHRIVAAQNRREHDHDTFRGAWNWPQVLRVWDQGSRTPLATSRLAPWLPKLAFANKQTYDEIAIYMLKTTEWFEFLYSELKSLKIVPWFISFLSTFPNNEGFDAIKQIDFPREYAYNGMRRGKIIDERNPDVQLMLRCSKLEIVAMTFKWHTLITGWHATPRDLDDLLDHFQLRPMLEHTHVKQIHLVGEYVGEREEGLTLLCLEQFARWIITGFREGQGREVEVYLHKRWDQNEGRKAGKKVLVE